MTTEQIDAAARRLCEIRGEDPDERVTDLEVQDWYQVVPRWQAVAREVRRHVEVAEAVASVTTPAG